MYLIECSMHIDYVGNTITLDPNRNLVLTSECELRFLTSLHNTSNYLGWTDILFTKPLILYR